MDPVSICEHFDFDKLLPPGRLNGFVNMIRLMQKQTKLELQRFYLDEEMSSNILSIEYGRETIARDPRKDEVAVLLSGGVDSSVALKLLQLQGVKVCAILFSTS